MAAYLALAILAGCAGSKESESGKTTPSGTDMERYEGEFRPSEYDMDVGVFFAELRKENRNTPERADTIVPAPPVSVQGYRVQILATTQIDEANARKAEAQAAFPDQQFYIAYDPPSYKVRAGNFLTRADAESYARELADQGYPDAWVVPDKVIKNPSARLLQQEKLPPR